MPLIAATATGAGISIGLLLMILSGVTVSYAVGCWLWPFTRCPRCGGDGKRRSPFSKGKTFGLCRRCDGTGRRLRWGRRFANKLRDLHKAAK